MDAVTLAAANAAARRRYSAFSTPTPPANPIVGQEWMSSALVDVRVSHAYEDRKVIVTPGGGEGSVAQEPSVWVDSTNYNLLHTGGTGLILRTCPLTADPTNAANWTKVVGAGGHGEVIGNGAAGLATLTNHASVYQEGNTLYCYSNVPADNSVRVWTASVSAPSVWTGMTTVLTSAQLPAGSFEWGNTRVALSGGTYYLLMEHHVTATGLWQTGICTAASPTSTFTFTTNIMTTLYPDATNHPNAGGAWLAYENGQWVLVYHANNNWNKLTHVFRATSSTLATDSWTPIHGGQPMIRRVGQFEIDQVVDPEVVRHPSGQGYIFWSGMDNRTTIGRIYCAPLLPSRKKWTGATWITLDPQLTDAARGQAAATRPSVVELTSDFAGTSTTFANLLGQTWQPSGTEAEVTFTAVVTASATGRYAFQVVGAGQTVKMGSVDLTANVATSITLTAILTKMTAPGPFTAGGYVPVTVQYMVPTGATLNIRPVAQAGVEKARSRVEDIAYREEN